MKAALDSNILIYTEGGIDDPRSEIARKIVYKAPVNAIVLPAQALAEHLYWLLRKARRPREYVATSATEWQGMFKLQATNETVMRSAVSLMAEHKLQIFDAIILAGAAEAEVNMLFSEDMQHGFRWRSVVIINPFLQTSQPIVSDFCTG